MASRPAETIVNRYSYDIPDIKPKAERWRGSKCLNMYSWIFAILAKRRSGKSTLIYNLLKIFASRNMIVFFCVPSSTFFTDGIYEEMRNYLEEKGVIFEHFQGINEDGVNHIKLWMESEDMKNEPEKDQASENQPKPVSCRFSAPIKEAKAGPKKKGQPRIDFLWICDDLSTEMKDPSLVRLCKNSHHYNPKVVISSQAIIDVALNLYDNVTYFALFRRFNMDNLEKIWKRMQPNISFEGFIKLYKQVTDTPIGRTNKGTLIYPFLFFDRRNEEWRRNLNIRLDVKEEGFA